MRIWTIQPILVWERLLQNKRLVVDKRAVDRDHVDPYRWMADQMRLRMKAVRNQGFPWWGWCRWNGTKRVRPDLRADRFCYPRGERHVRIELELADHKVLLHDYEAWHAVLNDYFLSFSEAEDEDFERRLACANIPDQDKMQREPFRSEILRSWERIFDLQGGDPQWRAEPEVRSIQATFWTLALDDVRDVTFFVGAGSAV